MAPTCKTDGCGMPAQYRGHCERHYRAIQHRVSKGKATWEALEAAGVVEPCIRGRDGLLRAKGKQQVAAPNAARDRFRRQEVRKLLAYIRRSRS